MEPAPQSSLQEPKKFDCCSLLQPKPNFRLIGHRGAAGLRPENTMAGFRHAKVLGLNWIELDARLTKCGTWVIFHDDTLERVAGVNSCVEELYLNELQELDMGSWFSKDYQNTRITTLNEIIQYASQNQIFINLEIKTSKSIPNKTYVKKLMQFFNERMSFNTPYPIVSSFNTGLLIEIRKQHQDLRLGYLIEEFSSEVWKNIEKYQFSTLNSYDLTTEFDDVQKAKETNIPSLVYTVNDPKRAEQLFNYGVCGIFTDRPDLMIAEAKKEKDIKKEA